MERQEAWEHFLNTTVLPSRLEQVTALHHYYRQTKDQIADGIVRVIEEVVQDAAHRQASGTLQACIQIRFSLLRTSLMEGIFEYVIEAVDASSSEIYQRTEFKYIADWVYPFFAQWNQHCLTRLKMYMGVLKPWFYELWQSKQLFAFQAYVVHAIRYAVLQLHKRPSFQLLELGEEFEIIVGEYGDVLLGESVFYCNAIQRTEESVHKWLNARLPHGYVYEHLENLDLSGMDYGGINMNYSRLQRLNLTSVHWSYASLIGSRFDRCKAVGADFTGSLLFDADFAHSLLIEAKFDEVVAPLDSVNEEDAVFFGIYPISFIYADLTNASFQDACIAADFRGAKLDGVNFRGADLSGSLMLREDEMRVNLTLEQRQTIKWS